MNPKIKKYTTITSLILILILTLTYTTYLNINNTKITEHQSKINNINKTQKMVDTNIYTKPTDKELLEKLTPEQYQITQNEKTERAFENQYWDNKKEGIYVDIVTGEPLFSSTDKYDSGSGWPAFTKPIETTQIKKTIDSTLGMKRIEVKSSAGSHLGHLFPDGPPEAGGERFCINSGALNFIPKEKLKEMGYEIYLQLFE
jgi:peptide methionine sulfoxide reductase msrA/msrB